MDESINDVSMGTPTVGADASQSAVPTSGDISGATPTQPTDGSTAVSEVPLQLPEDDSDLQGRESQPYVQGLLEARKGFRELYEKHQGLQQEYSQASQTLQQIEQLGGVDLATQSVGLMYQLFQPQIDQYGQPVVDPQTGLPQTSSQAFVQTIANQNWDTALDMTEHLLALPTQSGEPLLAEVMRRVLGLDPAKLELYRQIGSPADAAAMGLLEIEPVELEMIPQEFHDTYKRLNPVQRQMVQDANLSRQQQFQRLNDYRDQHRMQDIIQRNEEYARYQEQQQADQYFQQVEARGEQAANVLWDTHASSLMNELGQIQWSTDPQVNAGVQQLIMDGVEKFVLQHDPQVSAMREQAYELVRQAERLRAMNNHLQANQAQIRAQSMAAQIAGKARLYMTRLVQALQDFRGMASQANGANGVPRPVVSANGQNGPGGGGRWQPSPGTKLLSPEYFKELTGG